MVETFCPVDPKHRLSATREPNEYYCFACGETYTEAQLTAWEVDAETLAPLRKAEVAEAE